ncbi:hypothetical protein TNCV_4103341 [Trichonephila clavipes]|nr:hypothetical protein TNCV_4103341 [Trichonephila clavipes]
MSQSVNTGRILGSLMQWSDKNPLERLHPLHLKEHSNILLGDCFLPWRVEGLDPHFWKWKTHPRPMGDSDVGDCALERPDFGV